MSGLNAVRTARWQPHFRHSAGMLGSQFIRSLREGKLKGWKTVTLGVTVPPIDTGQPGAWVEVGPKATLVAHASKDMNRDSVPGGRVLGLIKIDGADTVTAALIACEDEHGLYPGMTLMAKLDAASSEVATYPTFELVPNP